eukprot:4209194-Pleurochrysis_carterae.AAC.1
MSPSFVRIAAVTWANHLPSLGSAFVPLAAGLGVVCTSEVLSVRRSANGIRAAASATAATACDKMSHGSVDKSPFSSS